MAQKVALKWFPERPPERLKLIWIAGALIRMLVFVYLGPFTPDDHYEHVQYVVTHQGVPPPSNLFNMAYHPPLYYWLAAPLDSRGNARDVQKLSLGLSILTLYLLYRAILKTSLIERWSVKSLILGFTAFWPQLIIYGGVVSNDCLAYLVGTLIFLQTFAWLKKPTGRNLAGLAVLAGMGLLTKGTFLGYLPPLLVALVLVGIREKQGMGRIIRSAGIFLLIAGLIGGFKFWQNWKNFGRPIVLNFDFHPPWAAEQYREYNTVAALLDPDPRPLWRTPRITIPMMEEGRKLSAVQLLHATSWYGYIAFESTFDRWTVRQPFWMPRLIYLAGVVPWLLIAVGLVEVIRRWRNWRSRIHLQRLVMAALVLCNLGLVLAAGINGKAFSSFQGRLVFPAMLGIVLLMGIGMEYLMGRFPRGEKGILMAGWIVLGVLNLSLIHVLWNESLRNVFFSFHGGD